MGLIEVLLQLEFEIILYSIQLYCSAVQPWLQLILFGVRFSVELLFLYIRFLGRTCFIIFKLVSASQREKLLEKRVHDWKSYVRDLDEHSTGLEKKIEYIQQDCVRTKCLLKQVVGERQRLVSSLQYLELCWKSSHEGSNVALTAVKDVTICREDSFIKDQTDNTEHCSKSVHTASGWIDDGNQVLASPKTPDKPERPRELHT